MSDIENMRGDRDMNLLEKKIDACLRWILANDKEQRDEIAEEAAALLCESEIAAHHLAAEDCVTKLLRELGVSQSVLGFKYLVYATMLALDDWNYIETVTKGLYPKVAEQFDTTGSRVERAMRNAIERAFETGDRDVQVKVFGGGISMHSGKVTNSEFVAGCAREVQQRMRKGE